MNYKKRISFSSLTTLAIWMLRRTWGMLTITGLGILCSLALLCAVPLYSDVAGTAGLREHLTSTPGNSDIIVRSAASLISSSAITQASRSLEAEVQRSLGSFVTGPQFSVQTQTFPLLTTLAGVPGGNRISLLGATPAQVSAHIHLLAGQLPVANRDALELMIRPDMAQELHVQVGSMLYFTVTFHSENNPPLMQTLPLRVVGIFQQIPDGTYWHGEKIETTKINDFSNVYRGIVANDALLERLSQLSQGPQILGRTFDDTTQLIWYYHLDSSSISITHLNDLTYALAVFQVDNGNNVLLFKTPFLTQTLTYTPSNNQLLTNYQNRVAVSNVPVDSIVMLVLGLLLFFVAIMMDLLVERQADSIAILRSRGASHWQIVASFCLQGVALVLIILLAGPFLAIPAATLLAHVTLPAADQGALNTLDANPFVLWSRLGWLPWLVALASLLTMTIALVRATSQNVLTRRRLAARSKRPSLLQILGLDGMAAILALVGFAGSNYVLHQGVLDDHLRLLLLSPLTLFQIFFLALALLLILMRFFSFLLQLIATLLTKSRGATLQLALTHMARAPQEPVRMTLLLALAIGFSIFTLAFTASQTQRLADVADYQVGADFAGKISAPEPTFAPGLFHAAEKQYQNLPGAASATLGYTITASKGEVSQDYPIMLNAVDADNFAQTMRWTSANSEQSLPTLMQQLVAHRSSGNTSIPAFVDAATWQSLHLTRGAHFVLKLPTFGMPLPIDFVALDRINFMPILGGIPAGGVLTDYQSFVSVYGKAFVDTQVPANTVWLRAHDDASSLQKLRAALNQSAHPLTALLDRQALIANQGHDPLYANMQGIMILGALTALLLSLTGNIVGSWLRARTRQTNFAVLRALGASTFQISKIHSWEQGIISFTALLLGIGLGAFFSLWMVPLLVFTGSTSPANTSISSQDFYTRQSMPPVNIIVPTSLLLVLGVMLLLCILSLFAIVRVSTSSSISEKLRLNED